jgi:hypothetical protein
MFVGDDIHTRLSDAVKNSTAAMVIQLLSLMHSHGGVPCMCRQLENTCGAVCCGCVRRRMSVLP